RRRRVDDRGGEHLVGRGIGGRLGERRGGELLRRAGQLLGHGDGDGRRAQREQQRGAGDGGEAEAAPRRRGCSAGPQLAARGRRGDGPRAARLHKTSEVRCSRTPPVPVPVPVGAGAPVEPVGRGGNGTVTG